MMKRRSALSLQDVVGCPRSTKPDGSHDFKKTGQRKPYGNHIAFRMACSFCKRVKWSR